MHHKMRASVSDILGCTDFATMISSSSSSPRLPPSSATVALNGEPAPSGDAVPSSSSTLVPASSERLTILHLGDVPCYHPDVYERLQRQFEIIRPGPKDLQRANFIRHLKDRKWGNFAAIMKPFWSSGAQMHPWDHELIDLLPDSVRIMAGAGAGFDWVRTQSLAERGIIYANGAYASTDSVANTALYHIISAFTCATASSLAARSGDPHAFRDAHTNIPFRSRNPRDHTLGIVGLGLIGFEIATRARAALGMKILYHDLYRKPLEQEQTVDATFYDTLEDMLPHTQCILLATPSGPPLLTARTLSLLPRGARVVNIARGTLIDEGALADALESGHISAAGLDVHANETKQGREPQDPLVNPRFLDDQRVQLTCHTGGASIETNAGFERLVMVNVENVLLRGWQAAETGVNMPGVRRYWEEKEKESNQAKGAGHEAAGKREEMNRIDVPMTNGTASH